MTLCFVDKFNSLFQTKRMRTSIYYPVFAPDTDTKFINLLAYSPKSMYNNIR